MPSKAEDNGLEWRFPFLGEKEVGDGAFVAVGGGVGDLFRGPIVFVFAVGLDGGIQWRFVIGIEAPVSLEERVGHGFFFGEVAPGGRHGGRGDGKSGFGFDVLHTAEA